MRKSLHSWQLTARHNCSVTAGDWSEAASETGETTPHSQVFTRPSSKLTDRNLWSFNQLEQRKRCVNQSELREMCHTIGSTNKESGDHSRKYESGESGCFSTTGGPGGPLAGTCLLLAAR